MVGTPNKRGHGPIFEASWRLQVPIGIPSDGLLKVSSSGDLQSLPVDPLGDLGSRRTAQLGETEPSWTHKWHLKLETPLQTFIIIFFVKEEANTLQVVYFETICPGCGPHARN